MSDTPKKRGRPALSPEQKRTRCVTVRFTDDELRQAQQRAAARGVRLGVWLRAQALGSS